MTSSGFRRDRYFIFFIALVLCATNVADLLSQDNSLTSRDDEASETEAYQGPIIQTGFLFADGVYYQPPYSVHHAGTTGSVVFGDGRTIIWQLSNRKITGDRARGRTDRASERERGSDAERTRRVEHALATNKVVVVWPGQSPLIIDGDRQVGCLTWLLNPDRSTLQTESLSEWLPSGEIAETWNRSFSGFQCSPEFSSRARTAISTISAAAAAESRRRLAKLVFDYASYPLVALSMLTIAITMGHLIGCHHTMVKSNGDGRDANVKQDVLSCMILIGSFSLIDLVWTVLAAGAGQMHELNPVARQLIATPYTLVGFKLATTVCALLILYRWRGRRFARQATWWSCLVCMMVSVRWVLQTGIV